MNVRELIALLSDEIDPETVVTLWSDIDGSFHHLRAVDVEQFTVSLIPGDYIAEEDLA